MDIILGRIFRGRAACLAELPRKRQSRSRIAVGARRRPSAGHFNKWKRRSEYTPEWQPSRVMGPPLRARSTIRLRIMRRMVAFAVRRMVAILDAPSCRVELETSFHRL